MWPAVSSRKSGLALTLSLQCSTPLIQQHLNDLNPKLSWILSHQLCLSIQDETEVVPTESRLRIFYSFPYFPVIAVTQQGIDTQSKGPSIKYVTLFWANFYPLPSPCHALSHFPGPPPKVRHTSRNP